MKAWHFIRADGKLAYSPRTKIEVGITLLENRPLVLGEVGLHYSKRLIDALRYAPGPVVSRVIVGTPRINRKDRGCVAKRTVIAIVDAAVVLRRFARLCALDVVHLWDPPEIVLRYLKTGDESIRVAAENVARASNESAAWAAAESASNSSAESAAWGAAESAALNMIWGMAGSMDLSAAMSTVREKQNRRLTAMTSWLLAAH